MTTGRAYKRILAFCLSLNLIWTPQVASDDAVGESDKTMAEIAALMDRMSGSQAALDTEVRRATAAVEADISEMKAGSAEQQHEDMIMQRLRREGAGIRASGLQRPQSDPQGTEASLAQRADEGGAFEADPRTRKEYLKRLVNEQKILKKYREQMEKTSNKLQAQTDQGSLRPNDRERAQKQMGDIREYLDQLDQLLAQHRDAPSPGNEKAAVETQKN